VEGHGAKEKKSLEEEPDEGVKKGVITAAVGTVAHPVVRTPSKGRKGKTSKGRPAEPVHDSTTKTN